MALSISRASARDAPVIHAIQMRAFAEEGRICNDTALPPLTEPLASIEAHIRSQTVLVARREGAIVGSARGILERSTCTIRAVLVEPACQGQGIGAALLAAVEQLHPGVEHFELTTNTLVPGNVRFYEKRGYRVHELTQYTPRIVLAQMRKPTPGRTG